MQVEYGKEHPFENSSTVGTIDWCHKYATTKLSTWMVQFSSCKQATLLNPNVQYTFFFTVTSEEKKSKLFKTACPQNILTYNDLRRLLTVSLTFHSWHTTIELNPEGTCHILNIQWLSMNCKPSQKSKLGWARSIQLPSCWNLHIFKAVLADRDGGHHLKILFSLQ